MNNRLLPLSFCLFVVGPLSPLAVESFNVGRGGHFEWLRLAGLLFNTVCLGGLVLLFVLPPGIALALRWQGLPARQRRWVDALLCSALFIPLPFLASAWQATFESAGLVHRLLHQLGIESRQVWQPWKRGIAVAALIHAVQLLPWVVVILTLSLRTIPAPLVEEMRLLGTNRAVRRKLLLPLLAPAIRLATAWCLLQTSTEIVVTDMTLVRTLAEEVYTQSVLGVDLGRESVATLPWVFLLGGLIWHFYRRFPEWPSGQPAGSPAQELAVRPAVWPFLVVFVAIFVFPVVEIARQFAARSATDDFGRLAENFHLVWKTNRECFLWSGLNSLITGSICAGFALLLLNYAQERRRFLGAMAIVSVFVICLPGPVLGFSFKTFFGWICDWEFDLMGREGPLQRWLYDGPAALPVIWIHAVRYLPIAIALQYALLRTLSREIRETARMEGLSDMAKLRWMTWPQAKPAFAVAVLAITLLSFGEVSTGKLVETPGATPFAQELFNQMHSGVSTTVAAMSLMQIGGLWGFYFATLLGWAWLPAQRREAMKN